MDNPLNYVIMVSYVIMSSFLVFFLSCSSFYSGSIFPKIYLVYLAFCPMNWSCFFSVFSGTYFSPLFIYYYYYCCCCFAFLGLNPRHMGVPKLGVKGELQLPAYPAATATWDPSCICNPHHSSRRCQILNPLGETRDQTCLLTDTHWICFRHAAVGETFFGFLQSFAHYLISTAFFVWVSCSYANLLDGSLADTFSAFLIF